MYASPFFQGLSEERLEEAAQANLQASQRGALRHAGAEWCSYAQIYSFEGSEVFEMFEDDKVGTFVPWKGIEWRLAYAVYLLAYFVVQINSK
jgi:hypothetical protein